MNSPICRTCGEEFENHYQLALHLDKNRKSHKLSLGTRKWIAKMLLVNTLSMKNRRELPKKIGVSPDYEPTELGEQNRANAARVLSGENLYENTHCPKCNKGSRQLIAVEHVESNRAWRNSIGALMITCENCRGRK